MNEPSKYYSVFLCSVPDIKNYEGQFSFEGTIEEINKWLGQLPANSVVELVVKNSKDTKSCRA